MWRLRRVRARGCIPQCPSVAAVFSCLHDSEQQQPQCPGAFSLGKPQGTGAEHCSESRACGLARVTYGTASA